MIQFKDKGKGDFQKTMTFFTKSLNFTKIKDVRSVADRCVERLKEATPVDSGLTADSWSYEISRENGHVSIMINNKNIQNGYNVALLIEYGHGTANGTWVEGKNFIDPIIREEYNKIMNDTWKEIERL